MTGPRVRRRADTAGYLARQRALFECMLRAMHEQREHLINGDAVQLERANRLLNRLLEQQEHLRRELDGCCEAFEPAELAHVHRAAAELRHISRANYLLACRGAQYADFSLSLVVDADAQPEQSEHAVNKLS